MQKTHTVILPTCRKKFLWWLCHYIISDILGWPNSETGTYVLQSRTTIKNELGVRFLMANLLDNCFYPFLTRKSFDFEGLMPKHINTRNGPHVRSENRKIRSYSKQRKLSVPESFPNIKIPGKFCDRDCWQGIFILL